MTHTTTTEDTMDTTAITTTATELEDPAVARTATVGVEPHSSHDDDTTDEALLTVTIGGTRTQTAESLAVTLTATELERLLHAVETALDRIS